MKMFIILKLKIKRGSERGGCVCWRRGGGREGEIVTSHALRNWRYFVWELRSNSILQN